MWYVKKPLGFKRLICPYASSEAIERRYVDVNGELHAPATLTLEKEAKVPCDHVAGGGGGQSRPRCLEEEEEEEEENNFTSAANYNIAFF